MAAVIVCLTLVMSLGTVKSCDPTPGWRGEERSPIAAVVQGSDNHTGLSGPSSFSGVRPYSFHSWSLRAAPSDCAASWPGLRGTRIGAASRAASCHGIFNNTRQNHLINNFGIRVLDIFSSKIIFLNQVSGFWGYFKN